MSIRKNGKEIKVSRTMFTILVTGAAIGILGTGVGGYTLGVAQGQVVAFEQSAPPIIYPDTITPILVSYDAFLEKPRGIFFCLLYTSPSPRDA